MGLHQGTPTRGVRPDRGAAPVPLKNKDRSPLPGPQLRGLSALMAGQRPRGFAAHVGSSSAASEYSWLSRRIVSGGGRSAAHQKGHWIAALPGHHATASTSGRHADRPSLIKASAFFSPATGQS